MLSLFAATINKLKTLTNNIHHASDHPLLLLPPLHVVTHRDAEVLSLFAAIINNFKTLMDNNMPLIIPFPCIMMSQRC